MCRASAEERTLQLAIFFLIGEVVTGRGGRSWVRAPRRTEGADDLHAGAGVYVPGCGVGGVEEVLVRRGVLCRGRVVVMTAGSKIDCLITGEDQE